MMTKVLALMTRNPDSELEDVIGFVALFVIFAVGLSLPIGL